MLSGLALYALGTLLFYPAAANESYGFFLAALYILTLGLAFFETTSNPYLLSMGAEETTTQRLNFAQVLYVGCRSCAFLQGCMLDFGGVGYENVTFPGVSGMRFSFVLPFGGLMIVAFYGNRVFRVYH